LDTVYQDLVRVIEDSQRVKEIKKNSDTKTINVAQQQIVVAEKPKPIKIKKYISYSDYKKICTFSNEAAAISVFENIDKINLDPTVDINYQGSVQILKNDKVVMLSSVKKETGCTLVQPIDGNFNNDRKRVVWTVGYDADGSVVIVCVGVVDKHFETKKEYNAYKQLLDAAKDRRKFSKQDLEKYLDISSVLEADKKFVKPFGNPGDAYGI
jgi:lysyl-tRNA synthetase class II